MSDFPRRIQMQKWCPAEKAIQDAVDVVEGMGADVRLTDAVILLGKARDRVADFVDGVPALPVAPLEEEPPRTGEATSDPVWVAAGPMVLSVTVAAFLAEPAVCMEVAEQGGIVHVVDEQGVARITFSRSQPEATPHGTPASGDAGRLAP